MTQEQMDELGIEVNAYGLLVHEQSGIEIKTSSKQKVDKIFLKFMEAAIKQGEENGKEVAKEEIREALGIDIVGYGNVYKV